MEFYYGNTEALDNLHMIDWEIKRIYLLLEKNVSLEALREDVKAILSEIEIVLKLHSLNKDKRRCLNSQKKRLLELQSHIKEETSRHDFRSS